MCRCQCKAAWLVADRIPKSAFLTKWAPAGLLKWTWVILGGIAISTCIEHFVHDVVLDFDGHQLPEDLLGHDGVARTQAVAQSPMLLLTGGGA